MERRLVPEGWGATAALCLVALVAFLAWGLASDRNQFLANIQADLSIGLAAFLATLLVIRKVEKRVQDRRWRGAKAAVYANVVDVVGFPFHRTSLFELEARFREASRIVRRPDARTLDAARTVLSALDAMDPEQLEDYIPHPLYRYKRDVVPELRHLRLLAVPRMLTLDLEAEMLTALLRVDDEARRLLLVLEPWNPEAEVTPTDAQVIEAVRNYCHAAHHLLTLMAADWPEANTQQDRSTTEMPGDREQWVQAHESIRAQDGRRWALLATFVAIQGALFANLGQQSPEPPEVWTAVIGVATSWVWLVLTWRTEVYLADRTRVAARLEPYLVEDEGARFYERRRIPEKRLRAQGMRAPTLFLERTLKAGAITLLSMSVMAVYWTWRIFDEDAPVWKSAAIAIGVVVAATVIAFFLPRFARTTD